MVPAHAEIIIEGVVVPHERHPEGPLAEWPGGTLPMAIVAVNKVKDVEVKKAALAPLNTEPDNLTMIILVDDDINIFNDGDEL